jgi:tetratricopeptide (TPR) repeat protein
MTTPLQAPSAPPDVSAAAADLALPIAARADTEETARFTETPTPLPSSAKDSAVTFGDPQPTRASGSTMPPARPVVPRAPTGEADLVRGFADQRTPGFADQRTPGFTGFADQRTPGFAGFTDQRTPIDQRTPTDPGYTRTATGNPVSARVSTDNMVSADEAFKRGELAMKRDQPGEAILEFKAALDLNPHDVDYAGMLAWAKFCAAGDKPGIGVETRKSLERAVFKSQRPERARFYLGRVERMLGRDKEALRHFQEVLDLKPNHAEAASEVRAIEARLLAAKGGGGLFGRKR